VRSPFAHPRDASVASIPASCAGPATGPVLPRDRSFTSQKSSLFPRVSLTSASPEPFVLSVSEPLTASKWIAATMDSKARTKRAEPTADEAQLADEIARAMHDRPLMSRLQRVGHAYPAEPNSNVYPLRGPMNPGLAAQPPPIPAYAYEPNRFEAAERAALDTNETAAVFGFHADNDDVVVVPPPSAEWLEKARRDRSIARLRDVLAWVATVAIGGAIISATMLIMNA